VSGYEGAHAYGGHHLRHRVVAELVQVAAMDPAGQLLHRDGETEPDTETTEGYWILTRCRAKAGNFGLTVESA